MFKLTTNQDYKERVLFAETTGEEIFGVKGKSKFSEILVIPEQVPFDYMHLILQGHTKWLLNQYFYNKQGETFIGK